MALIYLNRRVRVIWEGRPFASLKGFTIEVAGGIRTMGGDPLIKNASTFMYNDQPPDLPIGFGKIGIPEFKSGRIWVGAGPIQVDGLDDKSYEVWMIKRSKMLAEREEAVLLVNWHVTAVS